MERKEKIWKEKLKKFCLGFFKEKDNKVNYRENFILHTQKWEEIWGRASQGVVGKSSCLGSPHATTESTQSPRHA